MDMLNDNHKQDVNTIPPFLREDESAQTCMNMQITEDIHNMICINIPTWAHSAAMYTLLGIPTLYPELIRAINN